MMQQSHHPSGGYFGCQVLDRNQGVGGGLLNPSRKARIRDDNSVTRVSDIRKKPIWKADSYSQKNGARRYPGNHPG